MSTPANQAKHLELFAALAAEFRKEEVRTRPQGTRQIRYVTARTVMNRLDEVLGPANWWDEYAVFEHSVVCRLTIRLPDGTTITKCDAGGAAGMADQGDDEKSQFSDALKRAAVRFGVGRYLYGDGVPRWPSAKPARSESPTPDPAPAPPPPAAPPSPPCPFADGLDLHRYLVGRKEIDLVEFLTWLRAEFPALPDRLPKWNRAQLEACWPRMVTRLRAARPALKVADQGNN